MVGAKKFKPVLSFAIIIRSIFMPSINPNVHAKTISDRHN